MQSVGTVEGGYSNKGKRPLISCEGEEENVLMCFPTFNKTATGQFSHRGGGELAEDGEDDYLIEFDT